MISEKIKIYIITGITIVVLILVIYYLGRRSNKTNPATLPQDKPNSPLSEAEKQQVETITTNLHDEMKGTNWVTRDTAPHEAFARLGDKLFVAVYNKFNQKYFSEYNQTLKVWYDKEHYNSLFRNWLDLRNVIISRFAKLNLA